MIIPRNFLTMFSWYSGSSKSSETVYPKKVYGVYYYQYTGQAARVYLAGIYNSLDLAKQRLQCVIGTYIQSNNNPKCVYGQNGVHGWINEFNVNEDIQYKGLSCDQPHAAINLFE